MDACIFTTTINMLTAVYAADLTTKVDELGVNDRVCVTRIEPDWMEVHFNRGNVGRTGYLKEVTVQQNAQPTEPMPREEPYDVPPTPAPNPSPPPTQEQGQYAPNSKLVMICSPTSGSPYSVVLAMNNSKIVEVVSERGTARPYPIFDVKNNESNHILYIAAKRPDQDRTLYFAFDYSQKGTDVSAIRVRKPNGYDSTDRCKMAGIL